MGKTVKLEHQAKVIDDSGHARAKVPLPVIRMMGARPDDYLVFRLTSAGKVTLHFSRSGKKAGKAALRRS